MSTLNHILTAGNLCGLIFLASLTLFTVALTFIAYRDGMHGKVACLKHDCRMIGVSVCAVAAFALAIGFNASMRASQQPFDATYRANSTRHLEPEIYSDRSYIARTESPQ